MVAFGYKGYEIRESGDGFSVYRGGRRCYSHHCLSWCRDWIDAATEV